MDTALIIITLLSVGLTGALLVYATRLQREQRERVDARVLALAREIHEPETFGRAARVVPPTVMRDTTVHRAEPPTHAPWPSLETVADRPLRSERDDVIAELPVGAHVAAAPAPLFGATEEPAPARSRLIAPLIGVAVVSLVLGGVYLVNGTPATAPAAAKMTAVASAGALELVSLDQARTGKGLTIRGAVRNPAGAQPARGLTAVVFVFDKTGAFVTSARSPIDYQELAPGDESPFTVTVPNATNAARYRVSFRNDRDVVPHVDKRKR
jgi:hypothetical protein